MLSISVPAPRVSSEGLRVGDPACLPAGLPVYQSALSVFWSCGLRVSRCLVQAYWPRVGDLPSPACLVALTCFVVGRLVKQSFAMSRFLAGPVTFRSPACLVALTCIDVGHLIKQSCVMSRFQAGPVTFHTPSCSVALTKPSPGAVTCSADYVSAVPVLLPGW